MTTKNKIADFSKYQDKVDFSLAQQELAFAIIRVQYGSAVEDSLHKIDEAHCINYKIPFGSYAYARFTSVPDAINEAKTALSRMNSHSQFFVIDVEEQTCNNANDLVPATQAFIDYMHQHGVKKVGLYTGHSFYIEHEMNRVKADFLWIPRYPAVDNGLPNGPKPDMVCQLWQYTEKGSLAGVKGYIDLSMIVGDKPITYFTGAVIPAHAPTPPPVKNGWLKENNVWYYYKNNFKQIGWLNDGGKWYYLDPTTGGMHTGWVQIANIWYYLDEHGVMQTGWISYKGSWYYCDGNGHMVTGNQVIDGKNYVFGASGLLQN